MTMRSSLVINAVLVLGLSGPVSGEAAGRGGGGHAGGAGAHRGGGHGGGGHWHGGHGHGGCCAFGLGFYGFPYAYPYYAYPYPAYTYPYPAYTYPYPTESYPTYTQNVSVGAPATQPPAVQREVVYPNGKYVLYGDGVTQAWQWVWVPNAPPAPPR